jgi:hypothetical protein
VGASAQVGGVEFVKPGAAQAQFLGGGTSRELAAAMGGQEMTDKGSGQTLLEL